ncbi:MAG: response regulator [Chitinivibrionales bacterium]|nr:response regulator [Chitinivibrionales bacterium]
MAKEKTFMTPKKLTLLVVDDEEPIRQLLSAQLRHEGYTVLQARDGDTALSLLERNPIDVAIVDIVMPGKDGIQTITNLRITHPDLKIIAMSGDIDSAVYLTAADRLGVKQRLNKPFTHEQLLGALEAIMLEQ